MVETKRIDNNKVIPQTGKLYTDIDQLLEKAVVKKPKPFGTQLLTRVDIFEVLGEAAADFPDIPVNIDLLTVTLYRDDWDKIMQWFKRWFGTQP